MAGSAHAVSVAMVEREEGVVTRRQRGGNPRGGGVARGAGGGPTRSNMIGICGAGKVCLVARVTIGWRSGKHVIDVALIAPDVDVCPGEREGCVVVVEGRPGP